MSFKRDRTRSGERPVSWHSVSTETAARRFTPSRSIYVPPLVRIAEQALNLGIGEASFLRQGCDGDVVVAGQECPAKFPEIVRFTLLAGFVVDGLDGHSRLLS
jgi:hypothetical protein